MNCRTKKRNASSGANCVTLLVFEDAVEKEVYDLQTHFELDEKLLKERRGRRCSSSLIHLPNKILDDTTYGVGKSSAAGACGTSARLNGIDDQEEEYEIPDTQSVDYSGTEPIQIRRSDVRSVDAFNRHSQCVYKYIIRKEGLDGAHPNRVMRHLIFSFAIEIMKERFRLKSIRKPVVDSMHTRLSRNIAKRLFHSVLVTNINAQRVFKCKHSEVTLAADVSSIRSAAIGAFQCFYLVDLYELFISRWWYSKSMINKMLQEKE